MEARSASPEVAPFNSAEAARAAAYLVGPRIYRLTGLPENNEVRYFVQGCHGNGRDSQKNTAKLMNQVARDLQAAGETMPIGVIYAGDNLYEYGVLTPNHPDFIRFFHDIYYAEEMTPLRDLASWMILGNHDVNMHAAAKPIYNAQGEVVGINQAAHTYFANQAETINDKADFFMQENLNIDHLPRWNMPYMFYATIAGNTQTFFLNSNSILKDFLDFYNKAKTPHTNQITWLLAEYANAKSDGRQIIFVLHHPLVISGKRSFPDKYDSTHYIYPNEIADMNTALKELNPDHANTDSYNELIDAVYTALSLHPDLIFAAHEHCMSYFNNVERPGNKPPIRQFTAGGGGGNLDKRMSYRNHPYVGFHQQHNGFCIVTCDQTDTSKFILDVYTTEGLHLRFNESSHLPLLQTHADERVINLRSAVLTSCDVYFQYLQISELAKNTSKETPDLLSWLYTSAYNHLTHDHKPDSENRIVQDIQAYMGQWQLPDFNTVIKCLVELYNQLQFRDPADQRSFYTILQNAIRLQFDCSLSDLAASSASLKM